jgi:hypothetical protein
MAVCFWPISEFTLDPMSGRYKYVSRHFRSTTDTHSPTVSAGARPSEKVRHRSVSGRSAPRPTVPVSQFMPEHCKKIVFQLIFLFRYPPRFLFAFQ